MTAPARVAALRALRAVTTGDLDLAAALHRVRPDVPDRRDSALANEIVTGTLRWLGTLDHVIAHFAQRPLAKLDPVVRDVLRLSAYQLGHLDRVPASAVVNDAVELTRQAGKRSATGLTNAVLRAILRAGSDLPLPAAPAQAELDATAHLPFSAWPERLRQAAAQYLTVACSHPAWLVSRWLDRYGYQATLAWTNFNNRPAPITLRVNTLRTTVAGVTQALLDHGVTVRRSEVAPDGLVVVEGNPLLTELADRGDFLAQDEASQLIATLVQAAPHERCFDACASPGGKTVRLAGDMSGHGLLVAGDIRARRLSLLSETLRRCGAHAVVVAHDLTRGAPFGRVFDSVLVDAPCSGLGTLRRDPDIRWRREPEDIEQFADRQLQMLRAAAATVRGGGRVVYATCSSEPEENERVAEAFLAVEPDFVQKHLAGVAEAHLSGSQRIVNATGYLRTYPHVHALDAFFAASFTRR